MSNHIPNNTPVESRPHLFTQISQAEHTTKKGSKTLDSLVSLQANVQEKKGKGKKTQGQTSGRAELPPPKGNKAPTDFLLLVAEAYSATFTAMAKGTIEQTKDYAQLQDLDQTMSRSVLDSQNIAVAKEKKAVDTALRLQAKIKKQHHEEMILDYTVLAVGLAVMVGVIAATIVSGMGDGGASELAVPEEVELTADFATVEVGAASAAGSDTAADGAVTGAAADSSAESGGAGSSSADSATASTTTSETAESGEAMNTSQTSVSQTEESTEETSEETSAKVNEEAGRSSSNFETKLTQFEEETGESGTTAPTGETPAYMSDTQEVMQSDEAANYDAQADELKDPPPKPNDSIRAKIGRFFARRLVRIASGTVIGALMGSPMLVTGIFDLQQSKENKNLASIQETAGNAAATLQTNNAYFQYYQQLVKRNGNVLSEEGQDASEVVDGYASIMKAYRQINYGLANAV